MPPLQGFIAAGLCAFFFGSCYVPVKKHEVYDGLVFQWFQCSGIMICGIIFAIVSNDWPAIGSPTQPQGFYLAYEGLLSGFMFTIANIGATLSVKFVGLGTYFTLHELTNLGGSFLIGTLGQKVGVPSQPPRDISLALAGLLLVFAGAVPIMYMEPVEPPSQEAKESAVSDLSAAAAGPPSKPESEVIKQGSMKDDESQFHTLLPLEERKGTANASDLQMSFGSPSRRNKSSGSRANSHKSLDDLCWDPVPEDKPVGEPMLPLQDEESSPTNKRKSLTPPGSPRRLRVPEKMLRNTSDPTQRERRRSLDAIDLEAEDEGLEFFERNSQTWHPGFVSIPARGYYPFGAGLPIASGGSSRRSSKSRADCGNHHSPSFPTALQEKLLEVVGGDSNAKDSALPFEQIEVEATKIWSPVRLKGVVLSLCTGAVLSNWLTPFLFWKAKVAQQVHDPTFPTSTKAAFGLIFSICVGIYLSSSVTLVLLSGWRRYVHKRKLERPVLRPALLSGCLWTCALLCQLYASTTMPYAIAYAMSVGGTLLVSFGWGILWFNEVEGRHNWTCVGAAFGFNLTGIFVLSQSA